MFTMFGLSPEVTMLILTPLLIMITAGWVSHSKGPEYMLVLGGPTALFFFVALYLSLIVPLQVSHIVPATLFGLITGIIFIVYNIIGRHLLNEYGELLVKLSNDRHYILGKFMPFYRLTIDHAFGRHYNYYQLSWYRCGSGAEGGFGFNRSEWSHCEAHLKLLSFLIYGKRDRLPMQKPTSVRYIRMSKRLDKLFITLKELEGNKDISNQLAKMVNNGASREEVIDEFELLATAYLLGS